MQKYVDPNGSSDAPVKRQIIMVLLGFVLMAAVVAVVVNLAV